MTNSELFSKMTPSLTLSFALCFGVFAQAAAAHLRVPGIILLLLVGVLCGPDGLGIVQPELMGDSLNSLVGFAVAIILFEGGLNLQIRRIKKEGKILRRLILIGSFISAVSGMLVAKLCFQWPWRLSALFGSLVIVTGPTVVNPLLRRLRVKQNISTLLEAEGVLIDAVGAIIAAVTLDVALSFSRVHLLSGVGDIFLGLAGGTILGIVAGALIWVLLRYERLIPEGLENIFTLGIVLLLFQGANTLVHESGIAAVTAAGILVGNSKLNVQKNLIEFKEQLTFLFIGTLFVLLAADVRVADVQALGKPAIFAMIAMVFVVRPATVFGSTFKTALSLKEKLFIGWIGTVYFTYCTDF